MSTILVSRLVPTLHTALLLPLSLMWTLPVWAEQAGKQAFDTNCKACHQLTETGVGPSVKEIRELYPDGSFTQFRQWVRKPGSKRKNSIQMPAITHLSDDILTNIHGYILSAQLKATTRPRHKFSFKPPAKTYPYYQRGFMPFTSPAAIGIKFSHDFGVSWDASVCRMRYAFISDKNFFGGERDLAKRKEDIVFEAPSDDLWSFAKGQAMEFVGYRLKNQLPEFICRYGDIQVHEYIEPGESTRSFTRHFRIIGASQTVTMAVQKSDVVDIVASTGTVSDGALILTPEQAKSFSLTVEVNQ